MTTASPAGPLFVGVDGGGKGCRARIEDANGNLLGNGIAGPAALRIGVDRALAEVEKACRAAAEDAGLKADALGSMHAAVGLAGVGRKGALEELLLRPHAFRMALRAYDERALGTSLTRDVMLRFHNDPFEAVAWMDHANATDYATFAPLVMRHADSGDPVARGIIREAAEQIDELVRRLCEFGATRVALLGGLATSMQPWLAPDVQRRLVPVEGDAVDGALHLARRAAMKG